MATEAVGEKENGRGNDLKSSSSGEYEKAIAKECSLFGEANHESTERQQKFCSCE